MLNPDPPYAALIFDCDGTLLDTAAANESAWRTALGKWDIELDSGWYRARTGLPADALMAELTAETGREFDHAAVRVAETPPNQPHSPLQNDQEPQS
ncbi:hypothetical protein ACWDRB_57235 [Nonomuraea sp. NPDC003707]